MKFVMVVDMDNAAFVPDDHTAVGDLRRANEMLSLAHTVNTRLAEGKRAGTLRDSNGNRVGSWEITA